MNKKLIIAIIVILALGVVFGIFLKAKKSKQSAKNQITETKQSKTGSELSQNASGQNQDLLIWYEVPELKIKFKVDKEIASELIYKYHGEKDSYYGNVKFSSKKLSRIPGCGAEYGPLTSLIKLKGKPERYAEKDYFISRNPKQFDDFFIIYEGPQAVCASGENIDELNKYFEDNPQFKGWIKGAFETIKVMN